MNYFAGIGSREITNKEKGRIKKACCMFLEHKADWCLTSGAAEGADETFENNWSGEKRIFIPWAGFNKRMPDKKQIFVLNSRDIKAFQSVERFHPAPENLSRGARLLMARNYRQVVPSPKRKVDLVVFAADEDEKGNVKGGTAQAVRIARFLKIPCLNIRIHDDFEKKLRSFLKKQAADNRPAV